MSADRDQPRGRGNRGTPDQDTRYHYMPPDTSDRLVLGKREYHPEVRIMEDGYPVTDPDRPRNMEKFKHRPPKYDALEGRKPTGQIRMDGIGDRKRDPWEHNPVPITGTDCAKIVQAVQRGEIKRTDTPVFVTAAIEKRREENKLAQKYNGTDKLAGDFYPDEIARIAKSVLQWYDRPPAMSDEEVEDRLTEFFQRTLDIGEVPTVEKMYLSLGISRMTASAWSRGQMGQYRADLLQRGRDIISAIDAELVLTGKIPAVPYIFRAKNFYGMSDTQEVIVSTPSPYETESAETIARKYAAGMVGDGATQALPEDTAAKTARKLRLEQPSAPAQVAMDFGEE